MITQLNLDNMKEDAERGHGVDSEKTLDLILDINRLHRIMPHRPQTCKHNVHPGNIFGNNVCGIDTNKGICPSNALLCWHDKWELKE